MRAVSSGFLAELAASTIRPRFLFELELASTTLRYTTGKRDVIWDGKTWFGGGFIRDFSGGREDSSAESSSMDIVLGGEPAALRSLALQDRRLGKPGKMWFALLDSSQAIIADPHLKFIGKLSKCDLTVTPTGAQVELIYEPSTAVFSEPCEWRYNDASQKAWYPGDNGLKYMEELKTYKAYWGKEATK